MPSMPLDPPPPPPPSTPIPTLPYRAPIRIHTRLLFVFATYHGPPLIKKQGSVPGAPMLPFIASYPDPALRTCFFKTHQPGVLSLLLGGSLLQHAARPTRHSLEAIKHVSQHSGGNVISKSHSATGGGIPLCPEQALHQLEPVSLTIGADKHTEVSCQSLWENAAGNVDATLLAKKFKPPLA